VPGPGSLRDSRATRIIGLSVIAALFLFFLYLVVFRSHADPAPGCGVRIDIENAIEGARSGSLTNEELSGRLAVAYAEVHSMFRPIRFGERTGGSGYSLPAVEDLAASIQSAQFAAEQGGDVAGALSDVEERLNALPTC
jgi:hypothetical protein